MDTIIILEAKKIIALSILVNVLLKADALRVGWVKESYIVPQREMRENFGFPRNLLKLKSRNLWLKLHCLSEKWL